MKTLKQVEREHLAKCVSDWTKTFGELAKALGISRATLYRRLIEYNLKPLKDTHGNASVF